jgi:hypothetical protein
MRAKTDLRKPIKLFLPVQSLCEKDFPSRLTQSTPDSFAVSAQRHSGAR